MPQKLIIELTVEATEKYLAYASGKTTSEVNADCEPSGSTISIEIAPDPYDSSVYAYLGKKLVDFGEAKVNLVDMD